MRSKKTISWGNIKEAKKHLEMELLALGYIAQKGNVTVKRNKIVTFSCSSEFDTYKMVVFWKEHWESN